MTRPRGETAGEGGSPAAVTIPPKQASAPWTTRFTEAARAWLADRAPGWAAPAVVLPPLLYLGFTAVLALPDGRLAFLDPLAGRLLQRSVRLAAIAAGIALLIGLPYGWLMARHRMPGRRLLTGASLLPLLLPPYSAALAWTLLLGREGPVNILLLRWGWIVEPLDTHGSLPLAAAILGFAYWPVVAWITYLAARAVPRPLEESARLHLPAAAAARWTAGPSLRRAVPAAALLVFLLALADFGAANSLGVPVYPVEIVRWFQFEKDPGVIARLALPLFALLVPLVALQSRFLNLTAMSPGDASPGANLRSCRWSGAAACWLALGLTSGLPLATLAAHSLPLRTYVDVWRESGDHFLNTLLAAGGGALLATGAALAWGWATRARRRPVLDIVLTLPYAIPASLIGVAMIQLLNGPPPREWLYASLGGLIWTYAALFYPFAHKTLQPAFGRVDPELLDEGAVLGAGPWTLFLAAAWPALRASAILGAALVALLAAREVDATALLRIPNGDTIAFRIYDYLHFDPGPNVAALSILLVALSAAVAGAAFWWARGDPEGE